MYTSNDNLVNLFIKLEYLNSNYINLEFNDYLKKNVIYLAYNSPSFFLTGIFLKHITNAINIVDTDKCETDDIDDYMNSICKSESKETHNGGNLANMDSVIDQKTAYKPGNKNKTLKNIKFAFDKHYKIQLKLNMKDKCDNALIEKLLDCNQKIYNIIKHNVNFSRKQLKNKVASPKNSSSNLHNIVGDESIDGVILPPPGINKRSLFNESNSQIILFNDIIKRINKNEYVLDLFCDYKIYKYIKGKVYNEYINYGILENKEIEFNISKIILDDNDEIVPLIELINYI